MTCSDSWPSRFGAPNPQASKYLAVACADRNREIPLIVRGGRALRPAFGIERSVRQQNTCQGPGVIMLDHLFHPAQQGMQRLVLGDHFEDLAAIVLQPFDPLALADIPRDT